MTGSPGPEQQVSFNEDRDPLDEINRRFYEAHADTFSATRQRAWPGWQRVVESFEAVVATLEATQALRTLDVACGNGRFFDCLQPLLAKRRGAAAVDLPIGLERSLPLLCAARRKHSAACNEGSGPVQWIAADAHATPLRRDSLHLVTAFGLLHHVPGADARAELIDHLANLVVSGGLLALSFWQFEQEAGIVDRALAWDEVRERASALGIQLPARPEPGDHLLPWGPRDAALAPGPTDGTPSLRFCHSTRDAEIEGQAERLGSCGWSLVDRYRSDGRSGRLNHYLILKRN